MSRSVNTVADLWREWKFGISGSPSIESLEAQYGVQWRRSDKERKYFSRRKIIIDEIEKIMRDLNVAPEIAIAKVEEVMQQTGKKSLDGLSKVLISRRRLPSQ
ncbi:short-chain dehydrogenase [Dipodascopsis tothii]|uniref:short-chain dehydrogenase n=1 Tax=Dipodascopsis tothii TaxID=44089 RepID=UPI0034CEF13C